MNAWKVILATLVIFGAGMVTGSLYFGHGHSDLLTDSSADAAIPTNALSMTGAPHQGARMIGPPGPLMPMLRKDYLKNLDRELQLTDAQREHIEKIISDGQDQTKALWDQIAPQIKVDCQETRKKIQAELTPEQTAKFEAIMKRQHRAEEARHRESSTNATAEASLTNSVPSPNP
jgi:cell division protein FtsN